MWPKALTQLVELAPHVTRLLPLADRYFKDKAAGEEGTAKLVDAHREALEAQRAAVTDLSDRIHADLGAITSQQTTQAANFQRQMGELEKTVALAQTNALAARQAADKLEGHLGRLDATGQRVQMLVLVAVLLLGVAVVLLLVLLLRPH